MAAGGFTVVFRMCKFFCFINKCQTDIEIDGVLILVRLSHCLLVLSLIAVVRGQCRQCFGAPRGLFRGFLGGFLQAELWSDTLV